MSIHGGADSSKQTLQRQLSEHLGHDSRMLHRIGRRIDSNPQNLLLQQSDQYKSKLSNDVNSASEVSSYMPGSSMQSAECSSSEASLSNPLMSNP